MTNIYLERFQYINRKFKINLLDNKHEDNDKNVIIKF